MAAIVPTFVPQPSLKVRHHGTPAEWKFGRTYRVGYQTLVDYCARPWPTDRHSEPRRALYRDQQEA
ncbi:MAG: hypothetical protein HY701_02700 [Gemmatimonadetes bacterium]|nr:hypothetical protein [Gemmatimonadota bacterium]